ncbi:TPA_asm: L [Trifolium betacytorhabdovirus 1]|nr:TPA_asm: L [Trifolium betacytorhabdovirus 1]
MESMFDLDDIFSSKKQKGLGDYHLRSAITFSDPKLLEEGIGKSREIKSWKRIKISFPNVETGDPGRILSDMMLDIDTDDKHKVDLQDEVAELLSREIGDLGWLRQEGDPAEKVLELLQSNLVHSIYGKEKLKLQIGLIYNNAVSSDRQFESDIIESDYKGTFITVCYRKIYLFGDLIVTKLDNKEVLISLDSYRMIVDKFTERDNVYLASLIGHKIFPEIYPKAEILLEIFKLFDRYIWTVGNAGYKTMKVYEAVVTGRIISLEKSPYFNADQFLESTICGLEDRRGMHIMRLFQEILEGINNVHHLTQIMGLFRLWGHPAINPKEGVKKVRTIGTKTKFIVEATAEKAGWKFSEIFFQNYYSKKGSYPPHDVVGITGQESYLLSQLLKEETLNLKSPEYVLSDWRFVEIKQTFQIPQTFNLSMIVSDTAISPTRSELIKVAKGETGMMDASIRRGVVSWMKKGMINCKELLESVDNHPDGFDKDLLIIGEYPKEREMNPVARMFALMSMVMRSYVVITENMLSENVLPLIPGITMTYSLLDLSKEMVKNTLSLSDGSRFSKTFCINMDFEKWNLNMRKEATYHVFLRLGQIFGLPSLYNKTYDVFSKSVIYLADGSYIPQFDENLDLLETDPDLAYEGHLGGFEGLRQKGWTIFTVVLISYVCNQLGIKYKLMGQGDNQVLIVEIYSQAARHGGLTSNGAIIEIKATLRQLIDRLEMVFADVGLPLKKLETWTSDRFFSYGKFPIYNRLPCAVSLKRVSRIFFFSNEDLMTLDNALGAITANAQAGVMNDVHPIVCYVIARWQQLLCIKLFQRYHPLIGKAPLDDCLPVWSFKDQNNEVTRLEGGFRYTEELERQAMASIPKTLGGFNIITYFDVIMRGFSDPVNKDMQWLYHLRNHSTGHFRTIVKSFIYPYYSTTEDYLHLIQDPTSINILSPPNSTTVVKRMIHKTINNLESESEFSIWFKEVLNLSVENEARRITDKLTETENINTRLCHDILGATLFGYADSITSKVDKTVTLSRITLGKEDVVAALCKSEIRFWTYFTWRMSITPPSEPEACPSCWVRKIRNEGWKKNITAVSTPFPFHFITKEEHETDREDSYVEGFISDSILGKREIFLTSAGSSLPYLGSITKEKISSSASRAAFGTEPLITRPLKLMRTIGWFVPEKSKLASSLKTILSAVTDLDPAEVIYIPEHVKGSMTHRYSDLATKHGSLWMSLFGPPSHVSISTNSFAEYAKGTQNVTLHFQALLCMIQYCLTNSNLGIRPKKYTKFYRGCESCITMIDDDFHDISNEIDITDLPTAPDNPYLYVKRDDIMMTHKLALWEQQLIPQIDLNDIQTSTLQLAVVEHLALKQALKILYGDSEEKGDLTDLSGTPRTVYLKMPLEIFLKKVVIFLMMGISQGAKETHYPSFRFLKNRVIRRIQSSNSSDFNILAGWYLWEDTMDQISQYTWGAYPLTYPITPAGACQTAKLMLTNFSNQLQDIFSPWSGIILTGMLKSVEFILKANLMWRRNGRARSSCPACHTAIYHLRLSPGSLSDDLKFNRCSEGHYSSHPNILKEVSRNGEILEAIIDKCPRTPEAVTLNRPVVEFVREGRESSTLMSSQLVNGYETYRLSCVVVDVDKYYLDYSSLDMPFSVPTKAAYRLMDALEETPEMLDQSYVVLGDGFGYSSTVVKLMSAQSHVIGWTLIDVVSSLQHCLSASLPPVHYYTDLSIDTSPTLYMASDISNPEFSEDFSKVVQEGAVNTLISDVEPWYSGQLGLFETIVQVAWDNSLEMALIHLKRVDGPELMRLISLVISLYDKWKLFCPPSCNIHRGEMWIMMKGRKPSPGKSVSLNYNSQKLLQQTIDTRRMHSMESGHLRRWRHLDQCLHNLGIWKLLHNSCSEWFTAAGLGFWLERDYTQLYYLIKTGRVPRSVVDKEGNQAFYLHSDTEEKIKMRLLALVISDTKNLHIGARAMSGTWKITWKIDQVGKADTGKIEWVPTLVKISNDREPREDEILSKVPIVRYFRDILYPNRQKYDNIGDRVEFKYVSPKLNRSYIKEGLDIMAYLPITKQASYSLPENVLGN